MGKIILSICMMTYNQPEEAERALKSIVPQLTQGVELFIRDDSFDNKTEEIVKKYLNNNVLIRYYKGEKIGVDAAIIFLTEQSEGEYIWWFGDDAIGEGAIEKVLSILKKHPDISFMFINCRRFDGQKSSFQLGQDKFFINNGQILEELGISGLGFISSLLFKREKALSGIGQSKKYLGSAYVSLFLSLYVISQEGRYYFLSTPYVINYPTTMEQFVKIVKKNRIIKNSAFQIFGVNSYNIVNEFKDKFSKRSIKKILTKNFASLWRGMLVAWIGGWENPQGKRWKMFKLYWNFPEFWIAIWFFLMPLWINKIFYNIYKIFFSYRKFIFWERLGQFLKIK